MMKKHKYPRGRLDLIRGVCIITDSPALGDWFQPRPLQIAAMMLHYSLALQTLLMTPVR
jgi:hypothetical protein